MKKKSTEIRLVSLAVVCLLLSTAGLIYLGSQEVYAEVSGDWEYTLIEDDQAIQYRLRLGV